MSDTETYALLWSKSQCAFHVEPLKDAARKGLELFRSDKSNDYLLIGFGPRQHVDDLARAYRPELMNRHVF